MKMSAGKLSLGVYVLSIGILIGSASNFQRAYQDSWLLEGLVFQTLLLSVTYLLYYILEKDIEHIAIASCVYLFCLHAISGLKYVYPYGTAIDQGFHLANLNSLIHQGFLETGTVYSDQPGLYILLLAIRSFFPVPSATLVKFALETLYSLMPLVVLVTARYLSLPNRIIRLVPLCCVLSFNPYFLIIEGTSIGAFLLGLIVLTILVRESGSNQTKLYWTIQLILLIFILVLSHSISTLIIVPLLLSTSLVYLIIFLMTQRGSTSKGRGLSIFWPCMIGIVFAVIWWGYKSQMLLSVLIKNAADLIGTLENPILTPIPAKFYSLSIFDQIIVIILYHANFLVIILLAFMGLTYWRHLAITNRWMKKGYQLLLIMNIILLSVIGSLLVLQISQVQYFRFISYIAAVSPIIMAFGLWILYDRLKNRLVFSVSLLILLLFSLVQVFPYQPVVPKSSIIETQLGIHEPIVYYDGAMSAYQFALFNFSKQYWPAQEIVGADIVTYNEAERYWGINGIKETNLEKALSTEPIFDGKWKMFLTHRPGIAGPLS